MEENIVEYKKIEIDWNLPDRKRRCKALKCISFRETFWKIRV
jgi:hypothetical protein